MGPKMGPLMLRDYHLIPFEQCTKKTAPVFCAGVKCPTQLCGDCFINHEIRIPIKQPVLWNSKRVNFFRGSFAGVYYLFI